MLENYDYCYEDVVALCLLEHVFTIDLFEIFAFSVIGRYRRVMLRTFRTTFI